MKSTYRKVCGDIFRTIQFDLTLWRLLYSMLLQKPTSLLPYLSFFGNGHSRVELTWKLQTLLRKLISCDLLPEELSCMMLESKEQRLISLLRYRAMPFACHFQCICGRKQTGQYNSDPTLTGFVSFGQVVYKHSQQTSAYLPRLKSPFSVIEYISIYEFYCFR